MNSALVSLVILALTTGSSLALTATVCEFTSMSLQCGGGQLLSISGAIYGRNERSTCGSGPIHTVNCAASSSLSVVRSRCHLKSSCVVPANNGVFGDPCVGTYKYLRVWYSCITQCFGSSTCPNGGSCTSPDYCTCPISFYSPKCNACPVHEITNCAKMTCSGSTNQHAAPTNKRCSECRLHSPSGSAYYLTNNRCEPKCSWLTNTMCWPGTCGGTGGVASSCSCIAGFSRVSGSRCQLSSTNTPNLITCRTRAVSSSNEFRDSAVPSGQSWACGNQQDYYGNFRPVRLTTTFTFEFKIGGIPSKPSYIHDYHFGIVGASTQIQIYDLRGSPVYNGPTRALSGCTHSYSSTNIQGSTVTCNSNINFESGRTFQDGDQYCISYQAKGGGYLRTKNLVTNYIGGRQYYQQTAKSKRVCLRYDSAPPVHCSETSSCPAGAPYRHDPIGIAHRITKNAALTVTYGGWLDPVASGGSAAMASGVELLEFSLYGMVEKSATLLDRGNRIGNTHIVNSNGQGSVQFTLPAQGLYAVIADVKDIAGNVGRARRFVLYDPSSTIVVNSLHPLKVTSASSRTQYVWQTNHGPINVDWTKHFNNDFHVHSNMLRPIKSDPVISGSYYEQTSGSLPVTGTRNVDGIVEFSYAHAVRPAGMPPLTVAPFGTSLTITPAMRDGISYQIWIQAKDIMGTTKLDSVNVNIDASPPLINDAGVTNNEKRQLFVHSDEDLSKMNFQFSAMDADSGLHDVRWALGTSEGSSDVGDGSLPVVKNASGSEQGYCPTWIESECEISEYAISLNSLVAVNKHRGN